MIIIDGHFILAIILAALLLMGLFDYFREYIITDSMETLGEYEDEIDLETAQKALEDHIASGAKSIPIDEFLESMKR